MKFIELDMISMCIQYYNEIKYQSTEYLTLFSEKLKVFNFIWGMYLRI